MTLDDLINALTEMRVHDEAGGLPVVMEVPDHEPELIEVCGLEENVGTIGEAFWSERHIRLLGGRR